MDWIWKRPIAHRGLHQGFSVPENSLKAFELALAKNYPIELDIHLLKDENIVVFHDRELKRMTGISRNICQQSSLTLKNLKLLETEQSIPLLDEVFELIEGKVPILIEIKNDERVGKLEQNLLYKLSFYSGEYAVQSFNPLSIFWFKENAPHILRGQLFQPNYFHSKNSDLFRKLCQKNYLKERENSPNFVGYHLQDLPYLNRNRERDRAKIPILAWTIKTEAQKIEALKYADNIIFEGIEP